MRIKTKLYLSAAFSMGLLCLFFSLLLTFSYLVHRELEKTIVAEEITKAFVGLSILMGKYLVSPLEDIEQQIDAKLNETEKIINESEGVIPIQFIRNVFASLKDSFSHLKENNRERRKLLKNNVPKDEIERTAFMGNRLEAVIRSESLKIMDAVFTINKEAREKVRRIHTRGDFFILIFSSFLFVIMGVSALYIAKNVADPIKELLKGTKEIEEGNLEYRIELKRDDETGELSRAFNEMVKEIGHHRYHLEDLIRERTLELEKKSIELNEANLRLKELDRLKSMFIASMSHELRTPLNSVIGFSSIILNEWVGPLNTEQNENLSIVLKAGKHLLALINDVIDISKIEAGMIEPYIEEFDIYDVISEAVTLFRKEISEKGLELEVDPIHQPMHTDKKRLFQCVLNLLSNAVKFTEKGSVSLRSRLVRSSPHPPTLPLGGEKVREGGNGNVIDISIEDTGIGIKEEDMSNLFQPFVRLDSPLRSKVLGTGLGLYLTQKLVNGILKGEIVSKSRYGEGSLFAITIPANI